MTVRARSGRLSALCAFHSKSDLFGAFVWACRALNTPKWWFPARAVPLLAELSVRECTEIAKALCVCHFGSGAEIMRQGAEGDAMYVLEEGAAVAEIAGVGIVKEYSRGGCR